ncbi:DNA alkylation repair protein [Neobittarella massiliensis]|uniref:DNA alkylation repair protein n=1 Tax=Neobittarella massiliensis (ex Bilen et al. 2018) TaxID=2041842 RepID=UPI0013ED5EAE|nr:DNA alkylation repair protein [Neobittarella massiliensis]
MSDMPLPTRWDREHYQQLINWLQGQADDGYRQFHQKILADADTPLLGVRAPVLQAAARQIAAGDWCGFVDCSVDGTQEETVLCGLVLGRATAKELDDIARQYIEAYIPRIHNWAQCDSFCSHCKGLKKDLDYTLALCARLADQPDPWQVRVAVVLCMTYLLADSHRSRALALCAQIHREHYYVQMALAWFYATAYLYDPDYVVELLQGGALDDLTHQKTISKLCESFRVSSDDKQMLRTLRRKKK